MIEIVLTREDANTELATVAEWLVADGALVRKGEPVCLVETSKASVELEAPADGHLVQLVAAGADVTPGVAIGLLAESEAELEGVRASTGGYAATVGGGGASSPAARAGAPRPTRKAAELAARHGLDLDASGLTGFVTVEHVERLLTGTTATPAAPDMRTAAPEPAASLTLPQLEPPDGTDVGALDPVFLAELRADPAAIAVLAPEAKADRYREAGAAIGEGALLSEGSLLVAPRIRVGAGALVGARTRISCLDELAIGELTHLGSDCDLDCRRIVLGANLHVGGRVRVGGGGRHDPEALFVAGDLTFVGDEVFINPCRPVLVGREVFLTMRAVLVTHNIGHSVLEGYENRFAPITIEDRAQVGIATVVYAGCTVGAGAIVGSGSYVVANVPAGALALGVPARVAGSARTPPSPERQLALARELVTELARQLELSGHAVTRAGGDVAFDLVVGAGTVSVRFEEHLDTAPAPGERESIVLTLAYAGDAPPVGVTVFDLLGRRVYGDSGSPAAEAVREYLRKRGIRLEPSRWRYRGGLL